MRKDGAYVKKERLNALAKFITAKSQNFKTPVLLKDAMLYGEVEIGLSEKRTREYIKKLAAVYEWMIDDNFIKFEAKK